MPGLWRLRVVVRRAGVEDAVVEFSVYRAAANVQDAPSDSQAAQWLHLSDAAMNQLVSLSSKQDLNDGNSSVLVTQYDYRAPDAVQMRAQTGAESIAIGPLQYDRDKTGQWTQRRRIDPFVFPKFDLSMQATNVKLGRQETLNGEPAQIVRFKIPETSGPGQQYAEWISMKDHRLIQLAMVAQSHFMMQYYSDYDSPQLRVAAPLNAQLASSSSPVPAGPSTTAIGTGDLEKGGAVVILIAGVVIGWAANNRKQSRWLRSILLAVSLAVILGSVMLFVISPNAIPSVDATTAAPGKPLCDARCAACYGSTGHGDGPVGKSLPVTPFDLTTYVFQHNEQYLDAVITNGRGYMPAFKAQKSSAQPGFTPVP